MHTCGVYFGQIASANLESVGSGRSHKKAHSLTHPLTHPLNRTPARRTIILFLTAAFVSTALLLTAAGPASAQSAAALQRSVASTELQAGTPTLTVGARTVAPSEATLAKSKRTKKKSSKRVGGFVATIIVILVLLVVAFLVIRYIRQRRA